MFAAVISFEPLNTGLIFSMKNICSCKIPDKHQSLPFLQMDKIFCRLLYIKLNIYAWKLVETISRHWIYIAENFWVLIVVNKSKFY